MNLGYPEHINIRSPYHILDICLKFLSFAVGSSQGSLRRFLGSAHLAVDADKLAMSPRY